MPRIRRAQRECWPRSFILDSANYKTQVITLRNGNAWQVTIVTQCSIERLWNLEKICERWRGPIAVGVFSKFETSYTAKQKVMSTVRQCSWAGVEAMQANSKNERYPVNTLRNLAWSLVKTSHALVLDVDFWPSINLRQITQLALNALASRDLQMQTVALVVPALHLRLNGSDKSKVTRPIESELMPRDFGEALRCTAAYTADNSAWRRGAKCAPFHHHGSTRFADWVIASGLYRLPCFITNAYEPYLVVRHCVESIFQAATPRFDPRFNGYGKNKLEWIAELRGRNYTFFVVPRAFVVHAIHAESPAYQAWKRADSLHRQRVNALYAKKLALLFENKAVRTPLCAKATYLFYHYEAPQRAWFTLSTLADACRKESAFWKPVFSSTSMNVTSDHALRTAGQYAFGLHDGRFGVAAHYDGAPSSTLLSSTDYRKKQLGRENEGQESRCRHLAATMNRPFDRAQQFQHIGVAASDRSRFFTALDRSRRRWHDLPQ